MSVMVAAKLRPKPFTWSYSRLKNFETCGKRHYHLDLAKDVQQPPSEHLDWGSLVHDSAAAYLSKGTELPAGMPRLKLWCDRILKARTTLQAKLLVEQKLAVTEQLKPCAYFDADVWYRAVIDVLAVAPPVAMLVDWKTGKILEDSVQLALSAAVVFAHYPEVKKLRTEFVWLKEGDDVSTRQDFTRADMAELWSELSPRLYALKRAYADNEFLPTRNKLCLRWCPVTMCRYHGTAG